MSSIENSSEGILENLICVNRVSKVVKGGRRFSFSACVVVGNGAGKVGYGLGKANEVPSAIGKATEAAKRMMQSRGSRVPLKNNTILYPIESKYKASKVRIQPSPEGTGIIAGTSMKAVFTVAGIQNITGKSYGSRNKINVVVSTINALQSMSTPSEVAKRRGLTVEQVFEKDVSEE